MEHTGNKNIRMVKGTIQKIDEAGLHDDNHLEKCGPPLIASQLPHNKHGPNKSGPVPLIHHNTPPLTARELSTKNKAPGSILIILLCCGI